MRRISVPVLALLAVSLLLLPIRVEAFSTGGGYVTVPLDTFLAIARPGDLIIVRGDAWYMKIAGYWHHVAIYIGNGYVVEATPDYGVKISHVSTVVSNRLAVGLFRVKTTDLVRGRAVQFVLAQLGKPYDYGWLLYPGGKQVYGASYYCSELAWASYLAAGGPDIDANPGFTLRYGFNVAPDEIAMDNDVYPVAVWTA